MAYLSAAPKTLRKEPLGKLRVVSRRRTCAQHAQRRTLPGISLSRLREPQDFARTLCKRSCS
eukprot:2436152-Alexandrium_andersonii.AAC.1